MDCIRARCLLIKYHVRSGTDLSRIQKGIITPIPSLLPFVSLSTGYPSDIQDRFRLNLYTHQTSPFFHSISINSLPLSPDRIIFPFLRQISLESGYYRSPFPVFFTSTIKFTFTRLHVLDVIAKLNPTQPTQVKTRFLGFRF